MKRIYRRLAIVGGVLLVGAIAVAQTQWFGGSGDDGATADDASRVAALLPDTDAANTQRNSTDTGPIRPISAGRDDRPLIPPGSNAFVDVGSRGSSPPNPPSSLGAQGNAYLANSPGYSNETPPSGQNVAAQYGLTDELPPGSEPAYAVNDAPNNPPASAEYNPYAGSGGNYAISDQGPGGYADASVPGPSDTAYNALRDGGAPRSEPSPLPADDASYQPLEPVRPVGATAEIPASPSPAGSASPENPNYDALGPAPAVESLTNSAGSLLAQARAAMSDLQDVPGAAPANSFADNAAGAPSTPPAGSTADSSIGSSLRTGGSNAPASSARENVIGAPAPYQNPYGAYSSAVNAPARTDSNDVAGAPPVSSAVAAAAGDAEVSDTPGDQRLDGAQASAVTIEKRAPSEIQIGKPAVFETIVRNVGDADATNVMVVDAIPAGAQFIKAAPQPSQAPDGSLLWSLGTLAPNESKKITLELMPQEEGKIGSVAQVLFTAQAGVRTICTRPMLKVEHTAPAKVLIGQRVDFTISVTNPGTGAATGVVIQEDVPEGLRHPAGGRLEYEIGTLRPQETRRLELTLIADKPGVIRNAMHVFGDGDLEAQHDLNLEVIAPSLKVDLVGPTRRYLERQAQYSLSVSNPGTAAAENVELVAHLPKGMKFVTTDHQGRYDPDTHAVLWSLEQLPAGETGVVQLTMLPVETGNQELRVDGSADLGVSDSLAKAVQVDGLAELTFSVADVASPIEVGSETTYVIRVQNNGSKPDSQVEVVAEFPAGLKPIAGDGPTAAQVQGQVVVFQPIAQLSPKSELTFKITAQGVAAGDQLVRVQVQSNEVTTPVTKEEHTRVYRDE